MDTIKSSSRYFLNIISKYYYLLFFILCLAGTIKDFWQITHSGTPSLLAFIIRLIIYTVILLLAPFLFLFFKEYEKSNHFLIAKIAFFICSTIIIFNWYTAVFSISLCILYAILFRKNSVISLLFAIIVSIIGSFFTSDFVFLMIISGVVILLQDLKTHQLIFLLINSSVLVTYNLITHAPSTVVCKETILLAFFLAFIAASFRKRLSGRKKDIISAIIIIWGIYIIYSINLIPISFKFIWILIPFVLSAHAICSLSNSTSLDNILIDSKSPLMIFFILLCIPIIINIYIYNAAINRENLLAYSYNYALLQYYITWSDFGFVQRGLLGEIIKLIFGYLISVDNMIHIAMFIHFLSIITIFFLSIVIYKLSPQVTVSSRLFIFIFTGTILYPYFFTFTFRSDLILAAITLICVILCIKNNSSVWLIPILSVIAMFIHPVYGFLIFSPVFITMCYRAFLHPDDHGVRNRIVLISSTLLIISLFFFFAFFSYKTAKLNVYDSVQVIKSRADGWYDNEEWLRYDPKTGESSLFTSLLYATPTAHTSIHASDLITYLSHTVTLKRFITLIPLIIYYFSVFFANSKQYNITWKRILCCILPFTLLTIAPLYIWEIDYGRWNLHLIFSIIISMQIPNLIGHLQHKNPKKEQSIATYIFLISELSTIITWYA